MIMAQQQVTFRQKDISRLVRQKRQVLLNNKNERRTFSSKMKKSGTAAVIAAVFLMAFASTSLAQEAKVFFSPRGGCEKAIVAELAKARVSIDVAMYYLTSSAAIKHLAAAKKRGVTVRVFLDKSQQNTSDTRYLKNKGVSVRIYKGSGLMHHKIGIIDGKVLITGSFNWSDNAEKDNQENLLIIASKPLIDQYAKRFELLWTDGQEFEVKQDFYELAKNFIQYLMKVAQTFIKFKNGF